MISRVDFPSDAPSPRNGIVARAPLGTARLSGPEWTTIEGNFVALVKRTAEGKDERGSVSVGEGSTGSWKVEGQGGESFDIAWSSRPLIYSHRGRGREGGEKRRIGFRPVKRGARKVVWHTALLAF